MQTLVDRHKEVLQLEDVAPPRPALHVGVARRPQGHRVVPRPSAAPRPLPGALRQALVEERVDRGDVAREATPGLQERANGRFAF